MLILDVFNAGWRALFGPIPQAGQIWYVDLPNPFLEPRKIMVVDFYKGWVRWHWANESPTTLRENNMYEFRLNNRPNR